jgi:hypothetical protein
MGSLNQTLIGPNVDILYGTCEVTDAYGIVRSCECADECDEQVFEDCRGNPREVLLTNERIELTMEVEFDAVAGKPERGDDIAFPEPFNVVGQVIKSRVKWEKKDKKLLTIEAKHWRAMGSTPTVTPLDDA